MIDSHCHLADEVFAADLAAVTARAQAAGISRVLCILAADDAAEARRATTVRQAWPEARFSVGVHPHQAAQFAGRSDEAAARVTAAVTAQRAVAIGEVGLDYHYDFSPPDVQHAVFSAQVTLARKLKLPLVIHSREATDDTLRILRDMGRREVRGVFHCFTGDEAMARAVVDLGFYLGVGGIITFPRSKDIRDALRRAPEDRLLTETDAPYLTPVPYRGQRNEPAYVTRVLEDLAALRGAEPGALASALVRNFDTLFGASVSAKTA
jgi:TatD DNase family protein